MRYEKIDQTLLLLMLLVALFSGYQILFVQFQQNLRDGVEAIATLKEQDEVVKKKNFELFSWLDANRGDRLANNDLIYTYERSAADIEFDDGFEVSISEKTLFRIRKQNKVKKLFIRSGIMHLKLNPKVNNVEFKLAGKDVKVQSQDAQLQVSKGEKVSRITVLSGETTITTNQVSKTLKKNEFLEIENETKKEEFKVHKISISKPLSNQVFYFQSNPKIDFAFSGVSKGIVQVSSTRDFSELIIEQNVSSTFSLELPFSNLYWRIKSEESTSETRVLRIKKDLSPVLLNPKAGSIVKAKQVIFQWQQQNVAEYEIEIHTAKGKELKKVATNSLVYETMSGDYSWRVRAIDKSRKGSPWSSLANFEVVNERPAIVKPKPKPKLKPVVKKKVKPQVPKKFEYNKATGATKIVLKKPKQQVTFEWAGKVGEYQFEVTEDPTFKKVRVKKKVKGLGTKLTFPKIGTFYWRAKRILPNGKVEFSTPKKVIIKKAPKPKKLKNIKDIKLKVKRKQSSFWNPLINNAYASGEFVKITWPVEEEMKEFKVRIYADASKKRLLLNRTVPKPELIWNNPPAGTFYYEIAQVDFWDQQSEFSDLHRITIEVPPELLINSPVELEEEEIKFDEKQKVYYFEWNETENAENYLLEIARDSKFKDMVIKKKLKGTKANTKRDIFGNKYKVYWRVTALGAYQQAKVSKIQILELKIPVIEKPRPIYQSTGRKVHPRYLTYYEYLQVNFSPEVLSYEIDDTQFNASLSGMTMGVTVKGRSMYEPKRFNDYEVKYQSGSTFEGQSAWMNTHFKYTWAKASTNGSVFKYGLQANYFSFHEIVTNELLEDETAFLFSGVLEGEWEYSDRKPWAHVLGAGAVIGQVIGGTLSYELRGYHFKNFIWHAGVEMDYKMMSTDTGTHTVMGQTFSVGVSFYFQPEWEELIKWDFWSNNTINKPKKDQMRLQRP